MRTQSKIIIIILVFTAFSVALVAFRQTFYFMSVLPPRATAPASTAPASTEPDGSVEVAPEPGASTVNPLDSVIDTLSTKKDILYATDRRLVVHAALPAGPDSMYVNERGKLTYGIVRVSIPFAHKTGRIEKPHWYNFEIVTDPAKHFYTVSTNVISEKVFLSAMNRISVMEPKSALLFIHGFNVTFNDAAERTAQLAFDLQFDGPAVLFSWPSQGRVLDYAADEAQIEWATNDLEKVLTKIIANTNVDRVYLIAHSMGSRAMTRALEAAVQHNPLIALKVGALILAAPDIDEDTFNEQIVPSLVNVSIPITLYASSRDSAMMISRGINKSARLGDVNPLLYLREGVDSIDASSAPSDILGHSYFGANTVLEDIHSIIVLKASPDKRIWLSPVREGDRIRFWRVRP